MNFYALVYILFRCVHCISIRGFVRSSVHHSVHPSVCPSLLPSVCPSVRPSCQANMSEFTAICSVFNLKCVPSSIVVILVVITVVVVVAVIIVVFATIVVYLVFSSLSTQLQLPRVIFIFNTIFAQRSILC